MFQITPTMLRINIYSQLPKPPVYCSRNSVTLTIAFEAGERGAGVQRSPVTSSASRLTNGRESSCDVWLALEARDGLRADDVRRPAPPAQFDGTFTAQRLW
ncbi:hypothetical protein EVAR_15037_1 [Eumeta japonica]|uniref:Uncharacterized protein n=1 Tax=Eumeta variegata TaxID=151549 RepID=A0A4C1X9K8_EUMVA|nr:hypothetical protein EVAR_15037_1 [Eumeta japonica]